MICCLARVPKKKRAHENTREQKLEPKEPEDHHLEVLDIIAEIEMAALQNSFPDHFDVVLWNHCLVGAGTKRWVFSNVAVPPIIQKGGPLRPGQAGGGSLGSSPPW